MGGVAAGATHQPVVLPFLGAAPESSGRTSAFHWVAVSNSGICTSLLKEDTLNWLLPSSLLRGKKVKPVGLGIRQSWSGSLHRAVMCLYVVGVRSSALTPTTLCLVGLIENQRAMANALTTPQCRNRSETVL